MTLGERRIEQLAERQLTELWMFFTERSEVFHRDRRMLGDSAAKCIDAGMLQRISSVRGDL